MLHENNRSVMRDLTSERKAALYRDYYNNWDHSSNWFSSIFPEEEDATTIIDGVGMFPSLS